MLFMRWKDKEKLFTVSVDKKSKSKITRPFSGPPNINYAANRFFLEPPNIQIKSLSIIDAIKECDSWREIGF